MALKKKQEEFIMALMESNTNDEAINKAGISQSTAYKYLRDSDFQAEYKRIRRDTMDTVTSKLQQSALIAVQTLNDVMTDTENSTPSSRVQASKAILENAYKGIELSDLQERIEKLEERGEMDEGIHD